MQGYTIRVAKAIETADGELLGVKLGRLCIDNDIGVAKIAKYLGVTRPTVYSWFTGKSEPQASYADAVARLIQEITSASK